MDQRPQDAATQPVLSRPGFLLRWTARGILIAGAAFWSFFCIADGIGDAQELGPMGFIMMMPAMVIALGVLYIAWRWELAGAILLLAVTALGGWFVAMNMRGENALTTEGLADIGMLSLIFILPFLIPAILLLIKLRLDFVNAPETTAPAQRT